MERTRSIYAALYTAVAAVVAAPALALAQATGPGAPTTGGGLATDAPARAGSGAWMLWLLLAVALIAVAWVALSARRRASQHR